MLIQIISLLLNVAVGLVAGACLLRLYMQWTGTNFYNPVGQLVLSLTNWLVLPMRRFIPSWGRLDSSSLLAAILLKLLQHLLMSALMASAGAATPLLASIVMALFDLLALALSLLTALLIAAVIASWLRIEPSLEQLLQRLTAPLLAPLRRILPSTGGLDFSPLCALVLIQVLFIVLRGLQDAVLGSLAIG
jgi:YggT family protein